MKKICAILLAVVGIGVASYGGWFMGAELVNDGRVFSGLGYVGGVLTFSVYADNLSTPLHTDWMFRLDAKARVGNGGFLFGLGIDAAMDGYTAPDLAAFAHVGAAYGVDDLTFTLKAVISEALMTAWTNGGLGDVWSDLRVSIGAEYQLDYLINELVALFMPAGYETGL